MTLAFCVDDRGGLSFNRRRQSRDRAVSADLLSQAGECTLWVEPCSRPLFPEEAEHIRTAEEPWTQAGPEDLCFLELTGPAPALERAHQLSQPLPVILKAGQHLQDTKPIRFFHFTA